MEAWFEFADGLKGTHKLGLIDDGLIHDISMFATYINPGRTTSGREISIPVVPVGIIQIFIGKPYNENIAQLIDQYELLSYVNLEGIQSITPATLDTLLRIIKGTEGETDEQEQLSHEKEKTE